MSARIGILSTAHMHSYGYAHAVNTHREAALVGVWDDDADRGMKFADRFSTGFEPNMETLLEQCDGVIITSENKRHAEMVELAASAGKQILCEKPLVTTEQEAARMKEAVDKHGVKLMTAFPCRYSPAFVRLKQRVSSGEIGNVLSICATNHGMCPFDWFVDVDKSGGGAMTDHVVHVADLIRDLLGSEPVEVYAQTGNGMYAQEWEDVAMLHVKFSDEVFATIDSSWSRPKSYKTWGDVTMNVVGEKGVIGMDMFGQTIDVYQNESARHWLAGYGSDMDAGLVADFVNVISDGAEPRITFEDGLAATKVFIAGYRSAEMGQPVAVA